MSPSINLAFTSALALGCLTPANQLNVHNVIMSFRAYYHISKPDFVCQAVLKKVTKDDMDEGV